MTLARLKQEAMALKTSQRIRLVQEIWDSIAAEPQNVPIPDWHRRIIEQRLAAHEAHPSATISVAEAKRHIRKHLAARRRRK